MLLVSGTSIYMYVGAWVRVRSAINTMSIVVGMPSATYHSHYNMSGIYLKFHSHPCYRIVGNFSPREKCFQVQL